MTYEPEPPGPDELAFWAEHENDPQEEDADSELGWFDAVKPVPVGKFL